MFTDNVRGWLVIGALLTVSALAWTGFALIVLEISGV